MRGSCSWFSFYSVNISLKLLLPGRNLSLTVSAFGLKERLSVDGSKFRLIYTFN